VTRGTIRDVTSTGGAGGRLTGKVALVTGMAAGIGRATFELFAAEGARVMGCDVRSDDVEAAVAAIRARGADAAFTTADVSRREDVERLVDETVGRYGALDVVVNNAAIGNFHKTVESTAEDEWDRTLAINLKSVYLVAHAATSHLRARGGGSIVNVSSVHAFATTEGVAAYAAAKGGVLALSRQMALDLARDRIRVNAVVPGAVDTTMLQQHATLEGKSYEELGFVFDDTKIGRIGRPEEVARAILFLASDDSSFMTGAPLIVDGGLLARL
jgi:NAD(P)-dependent dehydrogenase (short-subunit alcohol dehydrogenase family)